MDNKNPATKSTRTTARKRFHRTPSPTRCSGAVSFKTKHVHDRRCKRQRVTIDMWKCPNQPYLLAKIPYGARNRVSGPESNKLSTETTVRKSSSRTETESSSSSTSSSSSSESSESEEDTPATPLEAHQVQENETLDLLRGKLSEVDLPEDFTIPARFSSDPDFGPRCLQCGHRGNAPGRKGSPHPVDACPVIGSYGSEAFNAETGTWMSKPCLYPLCSRPSHHFTKMCPDLHAFCLNCGHRGHLQGRCDLVQGEFPAGARLDAYQVFMPFGMKTRKGKDVPDWQYHPKLPTFRKVTSKKRVFLFPWSEKKVLEFENMSSEERRHMAQSELYC